MLAAIAHALENPAGHAFVAEYAWVWPICEILHFLGMAMLFGSIGLLDLRMLGIGKRLPVGPLEQLVPIGVFGFILNLITGDFFVIGAPNGPADYVENLAFLMKCGAMALAGVNVGAFYLTGIAKAAHEVGPGEDAPVAAKVVAVTSLLLWISVIYFGRMIMYSDAFYTPQYYGLGLLE